MLIRAPFSSSIMDCIQVNLYPDNWIVLLVLFLILALSAIWYRLVITSRQRLHNHSNARATTPGDNQLRNTECIGSEDYSEAQVYALYYEYYDRMGEEDEMEQLR